MEAELNGETIQMLILKKDEELMKNYDIKKHIKVNNVDGETEGIINMLEKIISPLKHINLKNVNVESE